MLTDTTMAQNFWYNSNNFIDTDRNGAQELVQ